MPLPAPGEIASEFELETDEGETVSSTSLRGQNFVLYFYPQDDTQGCTLEAIDFTARTADFAAAGVAVIGVSPDSIAKHGKFRAKHGLGIRLASDPEHKAIEAYGVWQEKTMFARRYMGVVRSTFLIGADGRIAEAWRNVRVRGHADAVPEAARKLTA